MLCWLCFTGEDHDSEETVLADYSAGSARKREFPERERQLAHHASEGKNIYCVSVLYMVVFDQLKDVWCLQEREKLVSLEGKYAELSEGQTFSNNPVAIKEVQVSHSNTAIISIHPFHQSLVSCKHFSVCFLFLSSDSYDRCSTCCLWRKGEEAAKKTLPTWVKAYLRGGASSSSAPTADRWVALFLRRSAASLINPTTIKGNAMMQYHLWPHGGTSICWVLQYHFDPLGVHFFVSYPRGCHMSFLVMCCPLLVRSCIAT